MGILRQEYCHALLQGIFPTQGLNPCLKSPALAGIFFRAYLGRHPDPTQRPDPQSKVASTAPPRRYQAFNPTCFPAWIKTLKLVDVSAPFVFTLCHHSNMSWPLRVHHSLPFSLHPSPAPSPPQWGPSPAASCIQCPSAIAPHHPTHFMAEQKGPPSQGRTFSWSFQ